MDWTTETFGTVGNDALDSGDWLAGSRDRLADSGDWLADSVDRLADSVDWLADSGDRLARRWGEDSQTHEAWSHGLD